GGAIDLGAIAIEFLILGLDPYPRKPDAVFQGSAVGDDAAHPFAALAALKKGRGGGERGLSAPLFWVPAGRYCRGLPPEGRIALDAMGGDHGAAVVVPGAELSLSRHRDVEFFLFGDRAAVKPLLDARPQLKAASHLVHTDVMVQMHDKPSQALRKGRRKSSM